MGRPQLRLRIAGGHLRTLQQEHRPAVGVAHVPEQRRCRRAAARRPHVPARPTLPGTERPWMRQSHAAYRCRRCAWSAVTVSARSMSSLTLSQISTWAV